MQPGCTWTLSCCTRAGGEGPYWLQGTFQGRPPDRSVHMCQKAQRPRASSATAGTDGADQVLLSRVAKDSRNTGGF